MAVTRLWGIMSAVHGGGVFCDMGYSGLVCAIHVPDALGYPLADGSAEYCVSFVFFRYDRNVSYLYSSSEATTVVLMAMVGFAYYP